MDELWSILVNQFSVHGDRASELIEALVLPGRLRELVEARAFAFERDPAEAIRLLARGGAVTREWRVYWPSRTADDLGVSEEVWTTSPVITTCGDEASARLAAGDTGSVQARYVTDWVDA